MRSWKQPRGGKDLYRARLDAIIDLKHPLVRLGELVRRSDLEEALGRFYKAVGLPAKPTRLMVGLHYLNHSYTLSDEETVARWVESPYWQYFCGFEALRAHRFAMLSTSSRPTPP